MEADELKGWMKDNGWTVKALAAALTMGEATIWRWRNGKSRIPPTVPMALETLKRERRA
jgi:transcriptional regulator with XRE-family HTH domain